MYIERSLRMLTATQSNAETKILVRPRIEPMLSPLITDRDAVVVFDDAVASFQWAFWYQGPQYRALMERWFDDLWASIPDSYLIYSRNGFNQTAIDRVRKELEVIEAGQAHQSV